MLPIGGVLYEASCRDFAFCDSSARRRFRSGPKRSQFRWVYIEHGCNGTPRLDRCAGFQRLTDFCTSRSSRICQIRWNFYYAIALRGSWPVRVLRSRAILSRTELVFMAPPERGHLYLTLLLWLALLHSKPDRAFRLRRRV